MFQAWTEILPLFVIRWLSKNTEVFKIGDSLCHVPRPGVYIRNAKATDNYNAWMENLSNPTNYLRKD